MKLKVKFMTLMRMVIYTTTSPYEKIMSISATIYDIQEVLTKE